MIYINKGATNSVVLTLSESCKLSNPYFIFEFKNEYILDSQSILFFTPDLSNYTNRYNLFSIEESSLGATGSASNQALSLITGQYIYKVYESATSSLTLDNTYLIEEGRMVVSGNADDIEVITNNVYI